MEKIVHALRKLGLTEYEARVYTSLVQLGVATAKDASQHSGVPYSTIHHVLSSLESKGWIDASQTRPARYSPRPPGEAVRRALEQREKELQNTATYLEGELEAMYNREIGVERRHYWFLKDEQTVFEKIRDRAVQSKEILVVFRLPPSTEFIDKLRRRIPEGKNVYFVFYTEPAEDVKNILREFFPESHAVIFKEKGGGESEAILLFDRREVIEVHGYLGVVSGVWVCFPKAEGELSEAYASHIKPLW